MKLFRYTIALSAFFIAAKPAIAQEVMDVETSYFAVSLHVIELILAVFICFMAIRFFRITKPLNLFLVIYVSLGFFIINSLLYILFYGLHLKGIHLSFVSVYIGSRISLIAMLISISTLFYYLNSQMRKTI